ncbi:unnamed protein product [Phyllotreta striolata]|uniref:Uncharacterized protein n=1 Tax=Phyllotreta striolata TaxID=444603 RepID=A0A9N9XLJ0_PHYSR|nr:unnamed protein product [Phyllotreta striolata]
MSEKKPHLISSKIAYLLRNTYDYIKLDGVFNTGKSLERLNTAKVSSLNTIPESWIRSEIHDCNRSSESESGDDHTSRIRMPPKKLIGTRNIQTFMSYLPSITIFTFAGLLCTLYVCEWKEVLQHVPYYGGKYGKKDK